MGRKRKKIWDEKKVLFGTCGVLDEDIKDISLIIPRWPT